MYRLPLVWADGEIQRLQDGDILSPSSLFQYIRYYTPTKYWEIPHSYGRKVLNIPYWCYGDEGPFFCGVSERNSDSNKMRLELEEPMSGVLVYLNLSL